MCRSPNLNFLTFLKPHSNITIIELSQTTTRLFDNSESAWGDGITMNIKSLKNADGEAPARLTFIRVCGFYS